MDIVTLAAAYKKSGQYTDEQIALWLTSGSTDKGTWDASTNTPTLTQGVGTGGDYYHVAVAGTWDGETWLVGDTNLFDITKHKWVRIKTGGDESDTPITIKYLTQADTAFPTTRVSGNPLVIGDNCKVANTATLPFTIQGITFDSYNDKVVWNGTLWQLEDYSVGKTNEVKVYDKTEESISGTAEYQDDINIEIKKNLTYEYKQETPNVKWAVSHNLNRLPSVRCIDSSGDVILGEVVYSNTNYLEIHFSEPQKGKVYLS